MILHLFNNFKQISSLKWVSRVQVLTGSWDIEEHILETIPMVLLFYIN